MTATARRRSRPTFHFICAWCELPGTSTQPALRHPLCAKAAGNARTYDRRRARKEKA